MFNMTKKLFIYFCNVVKMVIIHKKVTIFGYKQVVKLETCLNPSTLWLLNIFYCKKLITYILNLAKKNLSNFFFW
jgi:hypothetical protein